MRFLLINIYRSYMENTCEVKFLLEGLECYTGTPMKLLATLANKLAAELKSDNVQYRNKIF